MSTEGVLHGDLVSYADLTAWIGVHMRTIQRWQRQGRFPRPIALGGRRGVSRWRRADVLAWLAQVPVRAA